MNPDNKFMNFLSRLGDLFILNVIYLLCCIPVITIGAATTALYYSTLKLAENRESYAWKDYLKALKENFKQSTAIWAIMLAIIAILVMDLLLAGSLGQAIGSVMAVFIIIVSIFLILMGLYVFPVLARFDNTVKNTIKNALIMAIRHFPSTIVIALIHGLPLLLGLVSIQVLLSGIFVVLIFTVSILAYFESKLFTRIFRNYYPKGEEYILGG